jgi:uncharacterized protein (DUF1810 family)
MADEDVYDLRRFLDAQDDRGTYPAVLAQLRRGRKTTHWMWFIFPQIAGLGHSPTAVRYAISSLGEARAYLAHDVLGRRLRECCALIADGPGRDAVAIFGAVDARKLQSSMTLFQQADPAEALFAAVLARYFAGQPDPATEQCW